MKDIINSIFKVFDRKQKRKLVYVAFMMLINSAVSLLSVSVLLPFIQAVMSPEQLLENQYVRSIYDWFGFTDTNQMIIALAVIIMFAYVAKNGFIIYMNNLLYRFAYFGKQEMQERMMKYYICQEYTFFLNHNSAELMRDINTDPEMFYAAVQNMLQLVSELCVSGVLIIYLVVTDPLLTFGVAVAMAAMVFLFMKKLRRILAGFGDDRRKYNAKILQCMQQTFGGIKEIKIANRESYFENDFIAQNGKYTYVIKQNAFLSSIPKPIMEALCIVGLMAAIIIRLSVTTTDPGKFIGTLAVFAASAFCLLPSANKMSEYLASIIHNGVVIHKIGEQYAAIRDMELSDAAKADYKGISLDKEISVEGMTFTYPDTEAPVLSDVNVTIPKNSSVAFIGPSGAGKTTMVDLILGVLKPQQGRIAVDGTDIAESYRGWHDKIGYIPQTIYMLDDTIRNNIAFGQTEPIDDNKIWDALRQAQLDEFVKSLDEGLDTMIGEAGVRLSGGQRQRIGIARALYRNPEVLVLDEATSALDTETETAVMEAIDSLQGKMTMLIIAHRLSTIKNCDVVYQVENGSVHRKE
jgi:ABC-type multidrug transport system fused ATPase/permease subunit